MTSSTQNMSVKSQNAVPATTLVIENVHDNNLNNQVQYPPVIDEKIHDSVSNVPTLVETVWNESIGSRSIARPVSEPLQTNKTSYFGTLSDPGPDPSNVAQILANRLADKELPAHSPVPSEKLEESCATSANSSDACWAYDYMHLLNTASAYEEDVKSVVSSVEEKNPLNIFDKIKHKLGIKELTLRALLIKHAKFTDEQFALLDRCAELFDTFENIAFLIYNICNSVNSIQVYGIIYTYLSTIFGREKLLVKNAVTALATAATSAIARALKRTKIQVHAFSDDVSKFSAIFTHVLDSGLSKAIGGLIVTAASMKMFSYDAAQNIYDVLGHPKKMSILELAKYVLDAFAQLIKYGELWLTGKMTFMECLMKDNPLAQALAECETLLNQKDLTYSGLPVPGKIDRTDWLTRSTGVLTVFKSTMQNLSPTLQKYKDVEKKYCELQNVHNSLIDVNSPRPTPACVLLYGDPAIGKSNIATLIYEIHARAHGRVHKPTHVYSKVKSSQYWDGYRPGEHPICFMSELGSDSMIFATRVKDETVDLLTSLVDSNPLTLDMSRADDKGKYSFKSDLIVGDTNNVNLNIPYQKMNCAAYFRRFVYVEPKVKDAYRMDGSTAIDPDKCGDGSAYLDKYTFAVYLRKPGSDCRSYKTHYLMNHAADDDVFKFYKVMYAFFQKHTTDQAKMLAARYDTKTYDVYARNANVAAPLQVHGKCTNALHNPYDSSDTDGSTCSPSCTYRSEEKTVFQEMPRIIPSQVPHVRAKKGWKQSVKDWFDFVGFRTVMFGQSIKTKVDKFWDSGPGRFLDTSKHVSEELGYVLYYEVMSWLTNIVARNAQPDAKTFDFSWPRITLASIATLFSVSFGFNPLIVCFMPVLLCIDKGIIKANLFKKELEDFSAKSKRIAVEKVARIKQYVGWEVLSFQLRRFATLQNGILLISGAIGMIIAGMAVAQICSDYMEKKKDEQAINEAAVTLMDPEVPLKKKEELAERLTKISSKLPEEETVSVDRVLKRPFVLPKSVVDAWKSEIKSEEVYAELTPKPEVHTSEFLQSAETTDRILRFEEETQAGKSYSRVANAQTKFFNSIVHREPVAFTGEVDELALIANRHVRRARANNMIQYITLVRADIALVNHHLILKLPCDISISHIGAYADPEEQRRVVTLTENDVVVLGNDYALVRLAGVQSGDLSKHFINDLPSDLPMHSMIGKDKVIAFFEKKDEIWGMGSLPIPIHWFYAYSWKMAEPGMCGWPLIVPMGNGAVIAGMHGAGMNKEFGMAAFITRDQIVAGIEKLQVKSKLMPLKVQSRFTFEMEEPIYASAFRHMRLQGLEYYGKLKGRSVLANQTSKLVPTFLVKSGAIKIFNELVGSPPEVQYLPPMMRKTNRDGVFKSPINYGLGKMSQVRGHPNRDVVRRCVDVLTDHLIKGLRANGVKKLYPNDLQTAINGVAYDAYLRRVDASKSAGFGYPGPKSKYLPIVCETESGPNREPIAQVLGEIVAALEAYTKNDACYGFVYSASLKDEPRSSDRALSGNTRLFYVSPMVLLILARMYLAPFYTLMVQFSKVFHVAIGVDMHREAHVVWNLLSKFASKFMEGDYSKYDLVMPFEIKHGTATVIVNVLKEFGYNETALSVVRGILTDELFPIVELLTDMFTLAGIQCSGSYATAEKNSLDGFMLFLVCWYSNPKLAEKDFFDYVYLMLYGDDVVAAVKPEVEDEFNNLTYKQFCADVYCMDYTPAAKKGEMQKFVTDPSFLKRTFKHHPVLDRVVAPIALDSIHKTLRWMIPSKEATPQEQYVGMISSVLAELYLQPQIDEWQYGKIRAFFILQMSAHFSVDQKIYEKAFLCYDRMTDQMVAKDDFSGVVEMHSKRDVLKIPAYNPRIARREESKLIEPVEPQPIGHPGCINVSNCSSSDVGTDGFVDDHIVVFSRHIDVLEKQLAELTDPCEGLTHADAMKLSHYGCDPLFREEVDRWFELQTAMLGLKETIVVLRKGKMKRGVIQSQSRFEVNCDSVLQEIIMIQQKVVLITKKEMPGVHKMKFQQKLEDTKSYFTAIAKRLAFVHGWDYTTDWDKDTILGLLRMCIEEMSLATNDWIEAVTSVKEGEFLPSRVRIFSDVESSLTVIMTTLLAMDDRLSPSKSEPPEYKLQVQSKVIAEIEQDSAPSEVKDVVMTDVTAPIEQDVLSMESPYAVFKRSQTDLDAFFQRPMVLNSSSVALNTDFNLVLDPWQTFFTDDAVKAKLRNVAFVKPGRLKIKFILSATKFHAGKLMIWYVPQSRNNAVAEFYRTNIATSYRFNMLKWGSQNNPVIIDAKLNIPVEIELGYVNFQPLIKLFNYSASALGAGGIFNDTVRLGTLFVMSLNQFTASLGTPTTPFLEVFMHMEGIELGTTTGTQIAIQTNGRDERKVGPIEYVASRVAQISTAATQIFPWATASSILSSSIAKVAAIYGWSRPLLIEKPQIIWSQPYTPGCNVIGGEMGHKLTLDPMQELSIDTSVIGDTHDSTSIAWLANIPSLLTTFTWNYTHTPYTVEYTGAIHPALNDPLVGVTNWIIQPTASHFAVQPFTYWRARRFHLVFEVVCNAVTTGKFSIIVEPNISQYAIGTVAIDPINRDSVICDLSVAQTFEVCIDLIALNSRPWLNNVSIANSVKGLGTIPSPGTWQDAAAGYWMFVPISKIQSPDSISLPVNVWTWYEDLEVNVMTSQFLPTTRSMTQSRKVSEMGNYTDPNKRKKPPVPKYKCSRDDREKKQLKDIQSGKVARLQQRIENLRLPIKPKAVRAVSPYADKGSGTYQVHSRPFVSEENPPPCVQLNDEVPDPKGLCEHYFGERPITFGSLLKRYVVSNYASGTVATTDAAFRATIPIIPDIQPVFNGSAIAVQNTWHLLSYLRYSYVGMRGTLKKRLRCIGSPNTSDAAACTVTLSQAGTSTTAFTVAGVAIGTPPYYTLEGSTQFMVKNNSGVTIEIPDYSSNLYKPAGNNTPYDTGDSNQNNFQVRNYVATWDMLTPAANATNVYVVESTAVGEDFRLARFIGACPFGATIS